MKRFAIIIAWSVALSGCAGKILPDDAVKDEAAAIIAFKQDSRFSQNANPANYHARLRGDHWEVWSGPRALPWEGPPCTEVLKVAKHDGAQEWTVCATAESLR